VSESETTSGLEVLLKYLSKQFDSEVFVLIDHYDSLVTKAMLRVEAEKELEDIVQLNVGIISTAVKSNEFVQHVFITGMSYTVATDFSV
jgi:hypothetical protein